MATEDGEAESTKPQRRCLLIDGTPLVVRAFHGTKVKMVKYVAVLLCAEFLLTVLYVKLRCPFVAHFLRSADGVPVNALYTYIKMLLNFVLESDYDYIGMSRHSLPLRVEVPLWLNVLALCCFCCCTVHPNTGVFFDHGRDTFRREIDEDYKANRKPTEPDLKVQFPLAQRATEVLGCPVIVQEGYEADDLIASYARHAQKLGCMVTIVSSDKDMCQLINDRVTVFDPMTKKEVNADDVIAKFGVHPEMMPQMQALIGDKADNGKWL